MRAPADPDLMNGRQVAQLLGLSLHSIYEGAARGEIPCRLVGRRYLFSKRTLEAWLHAAPSYPA